LLDHDRINYLIIGYGNTLRGDDGAGYRVAEEVVEWNLNSVRSQFMHQLTPELAEEISRATVVFFIDAVIAGIDRSPGITIELLDAIATESFSGHFADPRSLLFLTQTLYGITPSAYRILIPAIQFGFSEELSLVTQKSIHITLNKIKEFIHYSPQALEEYLRVVREFT
jgi:hydrogenase maturation protease